MPVDFVQTPYSLRNLTPWVHKMISIVIIKFHGLIRYVIVAKGHTEK